jgi:exopolysaccharide transport family protein
MQSNYSPLSNAEIEPVTQQEDSISLSQILHIFWLRRKVFLLVSFFIIAFATVALLQIVPRFTAVAKLLLGTPKAQIVNVDAVLSGDISNDSAIKSEIEILASRELAKKVITKLKLADIEEFNPLPKKETGFFSGLNPGTWLSDEFKESFGLKNPPQQETLKEEQQNRLLAGITDAYLAKLKTAPVRGTQVITVSFESIDPKLAAQIVNAHADTYIMDRLEAKFEATRKATTWLNNQLADLRSKVESSEKAVESYRSSHHLSRGNAETGLLREQLSEVNGQLIIARASKAEAAARLAQVQRLLNRGSDIESASEVLSSGLIQGLREQESILTRKISEMSVEYGAKHPQMIRAFAEKEDLQNRIKSEIKKIAAALENELSVASSREASLESSLRNTEIKSGSSGQEEVQLRILEREANANKVLFETFLNRFKETSSTQGMEEADARVISNAEIPTGASFPNKRSMMMIIVLAALFIASAVIFLLEMLNPGLRTPEEVEAFIDLPTLGLMPSLDKKLNAVDYILEKPHSHLSEAINSLRISLMLSNVDEPVKTVLITSSIPGEGKTTLALCLARSAANSGQRVIIIDTDLRRPSIEKKLGVSVKDKGLVDLLMSKETNITDYVFKDEKSSLLIMSKGKTEIVSSTDILTSHRMEALINAMKKQFDLIVFDSPPVMAVADARALAPLVDKTVFVVHWDKTPRKVIRAGIQQMKTSAPNIAGVVLQQINLNQYGNHGYGDSGYNYYYGKYGKYYTN